MKQTFNPCDECPYSFSQNNQESSMCKICEFKDYINAEKQGLLLRLPCKVGDTVYVINGRYTKCTQEGQELDEYSCQGCECLECDSHKEYYIHTNKAVSLEWIVRYWKDIGKTVFLTQVEAEQKLKELKQQLKRFKFFQRTEI